MDEELTYEVYEVRLKGIPIYIGSGVSGRHEHVKSGSSHNPELNKLFFTVPHELVVTIIREGLSKEEHLIILCGHYEGVDQRILDKIVDEEISIGNYVLTGGELPAMVLIDSVSRYVDGVLSDGSTSEESFSQGILEYPQYTRPETFEGVKVPEILQSGHHENINKWRRYQA